MEPHKTATERFEAVLQSLSSKAFGHVVHSGVRDISTFLELDVTGAAEVSAEARNEISAAQDSLRKHTIEPDSSTHSARESLDKEPADDHAKERVACIDDDHNLMATVRAYLGPRARHALEHAGVQRLEQFLSLTTSELYALPAVGTKTVSEILRAKRGVSEAVSYSQRTGSALRSDSICSHLRVSMPSAPFVRSSENLPIVSARWPGAPTHVDYSPDQPEPWSILRITAEQFFIINDSDRDAVWAIASNTLLAEVLTLPDEDWNRLASAGIQKQDTCDILLTASIGYLLQLEINEGALDAMFSVVSSMISRVCGRARINVTLSPRPIVAIAESNPIRTFRLDSFDVPEDYLDLLRSWQVQRWIDLAVVTEGAILERHGSCAESFRLLQKFWRVNLFAKAAEQELSGLPAESYSSFGRMMDAFVALVATNDRDSMIARSRMALIGDRRHTFDELALCLEVTRARAQQLWQKMASKLRSPARLSVLSRFWYAVFETLKIAGGACLISELATGVREKLIWDDMPNLASFVELLKLREDLQLDSQRLVVQNPELDCASCERTVEALAAMFQGNQEERELTEVATNLKAVCRNRAGCATRSDYIHFSEGYVHTIAARTRTIICLSENTFSTDTCPSAVSSPEA